MTRAGLETDALAAALLHVEGINTGFLSSLGPEFMTRLYRCVARHKGSFLLVVDGEGPGGVAGFLAGTESTSRLYVRFCLTYGPGAAIAARRALLRGARQAVETLAYARAQAAPGVRLPSAELLAMAVAPAARNTGVGRALVEAFQAELRHRAIEAAKVVADSDNVAANGLYRASGFRQAAVIEVHGGRRSNVLTWP